MSTTNMQNQDTETSTNTGTGEGEVSPEANVDTEVAVDEGLSGAEAAMARASARLNNENTSKDEQEQGDNKDTNSGETDETDTAGGADKDEPDSTVEIPADWPLDRQEEVKALPVEAQQIVLNVAKDMEAGLTQGLQTIADVREQFQSITDSMQEHGFSGERVTEVLATAAAFDADPQGTLEALANEAGIELFFSAEEATGQPPEDVLNDPGKYAKWVTEQAKKDIAKQQAHEAKVQAAKDKQAKSEAQLQNEFKEAETSIENFAAHKPAVIAKLQDTASGISVQDAYRLTTYDSLFKMAQDGQNASNELAKVQAELETLKKKGTRLPDNNNGKTEEEEDKNLSPEEQAFARAQKRLSAQA